MISWECLGAGHASENRLPREPQQQDHAAGRLRGSLKESLCMVVPSLQAFVNALRCLQRFAFVQRELRLILEERVGTDLGGTKPPPRCCMTLLGLQTVRAWHQKI